MQPNSGTIFFSGLNVHIPFIFDFSFLSFLELRYVVTLPKTQRIPKQMAHG